MSNQATALVVPYRFYPPKNGGQQAAAGFAEALGRARPLFVVSTPDNEALKDNASYQILPLLGLGLGRYLSPVRAWRIARFLRQKQIREVILFQPFAGLLFLPLVWLGRIELAVYIQNLEYQRFRSIGRWWWPMMFCFEWLIFRHCRHLYFISPDELPVGKRVFGLSDKSCKVLPFGTWLEQAPASDDIRQQTRKKYHWRSDEKLLLFFGPQSYLPNLLAVRFIAEKIMPRLRQANEQQYRFLICGGGLPEEMQKSAAFQEKDIEYLGYVPELEPYIQSVDLILNPIDRGGGVKTKVIEAIALDQTVLSFYSGALGLNRSACGDQLVVVADGDQEAFVKAIQDLTSQAAISTPKTFYEYYYWPKIVERLFQNLP